jgi:glutamate/tyrosine decarboxylase-like PLP-dependent enzyme
MSIDDLRNRKAPVDMNPDEFRRLGHDLVDRIADHFATLAARPVTPGESPAALRHLLGAEQPLPRTATPPGPLLDATADMLLDHSLFNAHPRFWGYITAGPTPIGVLSELLAAAVNPNVGAWKLAPLATEIESQTIRWIAEFIGYPVDCGGLMVSGGNMANFVCFLAARCAKAGWDVRQSGLAGKDARQLRMYVSAATHTWIEKAADLFGHGADAIRWIPVDQHGRLDLEALRQQVQLDRAHGDHPFLVVGTAGSVSTGAVDPLPEIGAFCRESGLWFHVDGAYGAFAALVPDTPRDLSGLKDADSVAVDPHKWLYAPLEAGCALVRQPGELLNTFSHHPSYYHFEDNATNYFDLGMQNSRGFRALKVWMALRHAGRDNYRKMIGDDIRLARHLYSLLRAHPEFEALSCELSITTFRYVPADLNERYAADKAEAYLDRLNGDILTRIESGGEAFLSNAVVNGKFALRACIVNFRTSLEDIDAVPKIVARLGRRLHEANRSGDTQV